jgi:hypothetical protein
MNARARAAFMVLAGCKADLPPITDANGAFDATCTGPYADMVVDTFPTSLDGKPALGAPDSLVVTLMVDQVVTVGFIGLGAITDQQGMDLRVHAVGVVAPGHAIVQFAGPDMQFRFGGDVTADLTELDIATATVPAAVYARVIGINGTVALDSLEAIHDACR